MAELNHSLKLIFAGIDGTGPDNDVEYAQAMARSFVRQLHGKCRAGKEDNFYKRGPTTAGNQTGPLGVEAARFVMKRREASKSSRIVLAGYSRGGAAVITAAQMLLLNGIKVDLMILFDAVDRSLTAAAGVIPPNVDKAYHLRRSMRAASRLYFGNCGTWYVPGMTKYIESVFMCTHGGVGGCPWWNQPDRKSSDKITDRIKESGIPTAVTYEEDLTGSRHAWEWISKHLSAEGIFKSS